MKKKSSSSTRFELMSRVDNRNSLWYDLIPKSKKEKEKEKKEI